MNETSASVPGSSLLPDGIGAITAVHFVLMAIVAVAAVAIIVAGIRRKRMRLHAERQVEARAEDAGMAAPTTADAAPVRPVEPEPAPMPEPQPTPEPDSLADEPIAAAAPLDATPASVAADIPVSTAGVAPIAAAPLAPAGSPADGPLTQLKGLGPKLADRLAGLGVATVGQMAALSADDAAALDAQLGPFAGRMGRDRWIEQARFLAAGDRAGFEAVFGRL